MNSSIVRNSTSVAVWALVLMLAIFALRLTHTAALKAYTPDEPHYIGKGLYLWSTGDYHFLRSLRLHPPLAYHVGSILLAPLDLGDRVQREDLGGLLMAGPDPDPSSVLFRGRVPFIALACWGAILVFAWARELAGPGAGALAALLYTTTPLVLAHGGLAHSDIAISVFYLQTLYSLWRWVERPSLARWLLCCVSLGLALMSKLSGLLLLPVVPLVLLFVARRRIVYATGHLALLGAVVLAVFWLAYGGSFATTSVDAGPLAGWTLPGFVHALFFDFEANTQGRRLYFLGEFSDHGWWYFFPVALLLKTPVPVSLGFVASLVAGRRLPPRFGLFLVLPVTLYLGVAMFWLDVPLGVRYVLPLLPLMHVWMGARLVWPRATWAQVVALLALLWIAGATAWIHPHYLAYFNALSGGPNAGVRYMVDSNLDWGQDLGGLAGYLAQRGNPVVRLAYFGAERPERYGIRAKPLRGCKPVSGTLAVSASVYAGAYAAGNALKPPIPGCFDWLRAHEPVARIGYSIFVYEIPPG